MLLLKGTPAALNYTYGPALNYRGPKSIDLIYKQGEPVVVVAAMIPMDELRRIELTRVRGFVFEGGTALDEDLYNFLMNEKRAAVIGCKGATKYICDGDMVAVDGVLGYIALSPTGELLERFQADRKKGPPSEKGRAIEIMARTLFESLKKEREEQIARGQEPEKPPTQAEVYKAWKDGKHPGLVYQLLSGLPLPNSPTAGEHGHEHPPEGGHGHGDEHEHDEPEKSGAEARREARRSGRDQPKEE